MAKLISTTTMILQNLFLVKNKGVKTGCARKGGRGKHNIFSLGGAFRKAKYEIRRRRKARAGKNSFPPQPPSFLPARAFSFSFCRPASGGSNQSRFCSKKVRAVFSNCDQSKLNDFSGRDDCSLAPPEFIPHGDAGAGLASQKARCLAIKSNGGRSPTRTCLESRRRFGIAKQFTNAICIQFFPFRLRRNTKPVFNLALYGQRRLTI